MSAPSTETQNTDIDTQADSDAVSQLDALISQVESLVNHDAITGFQADKFLPLTSAGESTATSAEERFKEIADLVPPPGAAFSSHSVAHSASRVLSNILQEMNTLRTEAQTDPDWHQYCRSRLESLGERVNAYSGLLDEVSQLRRTEEGMEAAAQWAGIFRQGEMAALQTLERMQAREQAQTTLKKVLSVLTAAGVAAIAISLAKSAGSQAGES